MLSDLIQERLKKLENFKRAGIDPYPSATKRTHLTEEVRAKFAEFEQTKTPLTIAGRVIGFRNQGGLLFLDVRDAGGKLQLVVKKEQFPHFELFRDNLDIGDFVEGEGMAFTTQRGEKSLEVRSLKLLVKSLRPLPDQWAGLSDMETRLRHRYLDILMNDEVRQLFLKKEIFWRTVREVLRKQKFLEVETPVLELIPGGADAEPFMTHHNALNEDFYLRISLELPLKKLLVAGYEKVFEIGRVFRNEGIDAEHLQDYTSCEFYSAYQDYKGLMRFLEKLYKTVVKKVLGGEVSHWQGQEINWGAKWPKIDYIKIFGEKNGIDPTKATVADLEEKARSLGLRPDPNIGKGRLIDLIYKKTVRPTLIQPAFLVGTPIEVSPLAKRSQKNPRVVERVQVVACGTELGNGWSELNDPSDQRQRFEEQMKLREAGDKEAQRLDEEFLEALEYGMPPAAGFGLSERFFAVLMDKPVRETVIFPLLRLKKEQS